MSDNGSRLARLDQLFRLVGLPQDLAVHFLVGNRVPDNPIRQQALLDLGLPEASSREELRAALNALGLKCDQVEDLADACKRYKDTVKARPRFDHAQLEARQSGWKAIAQALDDFRAVSIPHGFKLTTQHIGPADDELIYRLIWTHFNKNFAQFRDLYGKNYTDQRIETLSGLARWAIGSKLDELNDIKKQGLYGDLILKQLPVISKSAEMLRSNQYYLHQRWLSAAWGTEQLRAGKGLLPFAPSSRAYYALARKSRQADYELVTRIFDKMVAESGRDRKEVMRDIALAPYHYVRFACEDLNPGARLVLTFMKRLQEQTCRAQGPPEHLYVTVQEYLEINARDPSPDSLDRLWLSTQEEVALDDLIKSCEDPILIPPTEVLAVGPKLSSGTWRLRIVEAERKEKMDLATKAEGDVSHESVDDGDQEVESDGEDDTDEEGEAY